MILQPSTSFKKDLKKYRNNPRKMAALKKVLDMLEAEIPIPVTYRPHMLTGKYSGCMECHVENDYLLVWYDLDEDRIILFRLGSHSELF